MFQVFSCGVGSLFAASEWVSLGVVSVYGSPCCRQSAVLGRLETALEALDGMHAACLKSEKAGGYRCEQRCRDEDMSSPVHGLRQPTEGGLSA